MPVIQMRNTTVRSASDVIADMQGVLSRRYRRMFGRRKFLSVWAALRAELQGTIEYIDLRDRVRVRAGGKCEKCHGDGELVHHIKRVATNPELALTVHNAKWLCTKCHEAEHPHLRKQ